MNIVFYSNGFRETCARAFPVQTQYHFHHIEFVYYRVKRTLETDENRCHHNTQCYIAVSIQFRHNAFTIVYKMFVYFNFQSYPTTM